MKKRKGERRGIPTEVRVMTEQEWENYCKRGNGLKEKERIFSEEWELNFDIKNLDDIWERRSNYYRTEEKGMADEVKKRFDEDYKTRTTNFISLIYQ